MIKLIASLELQGDRLLVTTNGAEAPQSLPSADPDPEVQQTQDPNRAADPDLNRAAEPDCGLKAKLTGACLSSRFRGAFGNELPEGSAQDTPLQSLQCSLFHQPSPHLSPARNYWRSMCALRSWPGGNLGRSCSCSRLCFPARNWDWVRNWNSQNSHVLNAQNACLSRLLSRSSAQ